MREFRPLPRIAAPEADAQPNAAAQGRRVRGHAIAAIWSAAAAIALVVGLAIGRTAGFW